MRRPKSVCYLCRRRFSCIDSRSIHQTTFFVYNHIKFILYIFSFIYLQLLILARLGLLIEPLCHCSLCSWGLWFFLPLEVNRSVRVLSSSILVRNLGSHWDVTKAILIITYLGLLINWNFIIWAESLLFLVQLLFWNWKLFKIILIN